MNCSEMTVLVVEDEDELRSAIESDIKEIGFKVLGASDGRVALELVASQRVDIVLSDLNMPNLSGVKLLKSLREIGFYNPFIVLSGFGTRDEVIELLRLGAYNFIAKPAKFEALREAVMEAAKYSLLLKEAKVEITKSLGLNPSEVTGPVEKIVYDLAQMRAIRSA